MFGKGFLGDIGTRLQRLLKFDGASDASFDSKAIPVMIVGDGTAPGYGEQQGRRFCVFQGLVGGQFFYLRATADVIIERVDLQWSAPAAGASVRWDICPPGTTDPGSAPIGQFLDRLRSANDRPPLVGVNNGVATTGTVIGNYFTGAAMIPGTIVSATEPFCLAAGCALVWAPPGAVGASVQVWGQTL